MDRTARGAAFAAVLLFAFLPACGQGTGTEPIAGAESVREGVVREFDGASGTWRARLVEGQGDVVCLELRDPRGQEAHEFRLCEPLWVSPSPEPEDESVALGRGPSPITEGKALIHGLVKATRVQISLEDGTEQTLDVVGSPVGVWITEIPGDVAVTGFRVELAEGGGWKDQPGVLPFLNSSDDPLADDQSPEPFPPE